MIHGMGWDKNLQSSSVWQGDNYFERVGESSYQKREMVCFGDFPEALGQ
jgi:hypothetical protein